MNTDLLLDAIGEIDEKKIQFAKAARAGSKGRALRKTLSLAAAVMLLITVSLPVLAETVNPVYQMLYQISPAVAQRLKPIRLSCEDEGIKLEMISADVSKNEALIYLSLQDVSGQKRIDETTDLFDSYGIHQSFDSIGNCQFVAFDEDTGIATFLVKIRPMGDEKIDESKITFFFTQFLSHKQSFEGELAGFDLQQAGEISQTQTPAPEQIRGWIGSHASDPVPETACLIPTAEGICSPLAGVRVTNLGFIDRQLHIQLHFDDILLYDNHGYIDLIQEDGRSADCRVLSFWDESGTGSYEELIFDVSPETLDRYRAIGSFVSCANNTKGFWQITFPLENNTDAELP